MTEEFGSNSLAPLRLKPDGLILYSLAVLCANGADDAWAVGKCPVLMRCLDFDDQSVERIFRETHELGDLGCESGRTARPQAP